MPWWYPIPAVTTMSRGYNPPTHLGLDFATFAPAPPLPPQPVYSTEAGTVVQANDEPLGFGNVIVLQHAQDTGKGPWRSLYAHLSRIDVALGQPVAQGQQLGISGGGANDPGHGDSSGRHLHFQIMDGGGMNSANTIDPAPLLTEPQEDDMTPEEHAWLLALWEAYVNQTVQGTVAGINQTNLDVPKIKTDVEALQVELAAVKAMVAKIPTTGAGSTPPDYQGTVTLKPKTP